jgi:outer membrane lipoprotein-sorting protein
MRIAAAAERTRARQLLALYLRNGIRQQFIGVQTTTLYGPRALESQQTWTQAGAGRKRIEYLSPPPVKGEILVVNGQRMLKYRPSTNRIYIGPTFGTEGQTRADELLAASDINKNPMRITGQESIAGRAASILEIIFPRLKMRKRLWIDEETGVRLKIEDSTADGQLVSSTTFTKIDYAAPVNAGLFMPKGLPQAPIEPMVPTHAALPSASAAIEGAGFAVREPNVPPGFRLDGAWLNELRNGRNSVALRYTNGLATFVLWQINAPSRPGAAPTSSTTSAVRGDRLFKQWQSGGIQFILIGNVRPIVQQAIIDSLS